MAAPFLQQIDWRRPWLALLQPAAQPIMAADNWRAALNDAAHALDLCNHQALPIQFVPQADLPEGVAYEAFISDTGCVPTRDNLHDFFNALVWLTFPRIKRQLNALQAAELRNKRAADDMPGKAIGMRGKLRDAATIFDENAALVVCSDPAWFAGLRAHRWQDVLLRQRQAFGQTVQVFLFGHALIEKLVMPYKAISAHAWLIPADAAFFSWPRPEQLAWIDAAVAQQLQPGLHTGGFTPLPILGVPGWWEGQDDAFYADTQVFRPKRT